MTKIRITNNIEIAPGIYALSFKKFFQFIPGQVIKVTTSTTIAPRMYSIASGTKDAAVQIIFDIKPEGELTNVLKKLVAGDEIYVSDPFGQFVCNESNAWWIAAGTGIAPFYSMFRSGNNSGVTLLHGARNRESFLFNDEFKNNTRIKYVPCCSGSSFEGSFRGRVTDYLKQIPQLPANTKFYLCGSAEMVVDARDLLIERGVRYENILSEIYF